MQPQSDLITDDIQAYLQQHQEKELLRLLTCGSVDDGKSTLIGRLLHDSKLIYEDQLAAITRDSAAQGTTDGGLDLALLVDGLRAEREQGITIDVAYRYFSTAKRKFIIADTPGHEQYTRNMATGASNCNLAVILIDARNGIITQTKRHSFIVSLLGIKHVVVAVNKMDLVGYSQAVYDRIKDEYTAFAQRLELGDLQFIPMSALHGDNVVERSSHMPWYEGEPMMQVLETVPFASDRNLTDLRFPVQYVSRPTADFRGYCGTVASGVIRRGDPIMVLPGKTRSRVRSIVTYDGELEEAYPPMAVTVTLEDEVDISRGDMLVPPDNPTDLAHEVEAMVVWMAEEPMVPGKPYLLKHTTRTLPATISTLRYQINVNTMDREHAPTLGLNEIGRCTLSLKKFLASDPYKLNRATGALIIIDRLTNGTVGAGMIIDPTRHDATYAWDDWDALLRESAVARAAHRVTHVERSARFGQRAMTLLLTGLTGSGKATIAYGLERRLFELGRACNVLDAHNMRSGISRDLGLTATDRTENVRRASEVARLVNDAGLICIIPLLAPTEAGRAQARHLIGEDRFVEVFLTAPLHVCKERDSAGLYERAEQGIIPDFPGITAPFEEPTNPHLILETDGLTVDECIERVLTLLQSQGWLAAVRPSEDYSI